MIYTVKGNIWANVRATPGGTIIAALKQGDTIDVVKTVTAAGVLWAEFTPTIGGAVLRYMDTTTPQAAYVAMSVLQSPVVIPPPVTGHGAPWLGVNTIVSASSALDAAAKGCRAFLIIDNEMLCRQIKRAHPEAVVVARRWIAGSIKPNGDQLANLLGGADDNVIYETLNEADNWPYGTVDQIRNRIDIELRATELMRTKGIKVCMGGYSMGTPGFVLKDGSPDMDIINQVKRYAAVYNSDPGVFFSMHLYSPNMNRVGAMDKWYELRYQWLFTHCGFDPTLRKIISTEGGVDEGGVGGFPAHNTTTMQFETWCASYQSAQTNTPLLATMIFQYSQSTNNRWAGYEIAPWIGSLQSRGWK